jgi:gamma-glutamyl-gamma-aminobutyrate hydrolase PuuD
MGVGLVVVCLLAVTALVDVSAAFLQRQQVMAVADAAAIAGAQAIDLPAYYAEGASAATHLDPDRVEAAVEAHLTLAQARRIIPGLALCRVWSDGRQVVVAMRAPVHLPFLSGLFGGEVGVESWAQLEYRAGG